MTRRALVAVVIVYAALTARAAATLGTSYEEAVPYVTVPLGIVDHVSGAGTPRLAAVAHGPWVLSSQLPRLAVDVGGARLSILNQPYMTNHLSFGAVALARLGVPALAAARAWHALFGALLLLVLFDVGRRLADERTALVAALLAATSVNVTFMFAWARFDESLPSIAPLVALWAFVRGREDPRARWRWIAALAIGAGVSGKITTLWPLAAIALAALAAGWRPRPSARALVPALAAALLLVPLVAFALRAPAAASSHETGRRLAFFGDLFTSGAIPAAARNLIEYLGSWDSLLGEILRGPAGAGLGVGGALGCALALATLVWIAAGALRPGPVPRARRRETQLAVVIVSLFVLVALFYREHRDYQFVLLVPLWFLGAAGSIVAAARWLERRVRVPAWAALAVALVPFLAVNAAAQARFARDERRAANAMLDLTALRAAAAYLDAHGITRPLTTTFYAPGQLELLTAGRVRPLHLFPLFRHSRDGAHAPDLRATWRDVLLIRGEALGGAADEPRSIRGEALGGAADEGGRNAPRSINLPASRWVLLPLGENVVEARHFAEADIRAAFLAEAPDAGGATLRATFANAAGQPLLELYEVGPAPPAPPVAPIVAPGLVAGAVIGPFTIARAVATDDGFTVYARRGDDEVEYDIVPYQDTPHPPARTARFAIYYRRPPASLTSDDMVAGAVALAALVRDPPSP